MLYKVKILIKKFPLINRIDCLNLGVFGIIFATFFDHFEDTTQKYEFMTFVAIAKHNSNKCHALLSH
jgi:hypothetical protein